MAGLFSSLRLGVFATLRLIPSPAKAPEGWRTRRSAHSLVIGQRASVLDCGGKRSATPLSHAGKTFGSMILPVRPKAPSPLRSAGALQIRPPQTAILPLVGHFDQKTLFFAIFTVFKAKP
jgi:hypothetical protein